MRGASTHGDVLNVHTEALWMDTRRGEGRGEGGSAHIEFSLPEVHLKKLLDLTHFQFENKSNTARSRFL